MTNFSEWIKNLSLEYVLSLSFLIILIVLVIYAIIKITSVKKHLVRESIKLTEDMLIANEVHNTRVKITNASFFNVVIQEFGFMKKNIKHALKTEKITLDERDNIQQTFTSDEVRAIFEDDKKSKIYFYVIDNVNKISKIKLKTLNKYIKKEKKKEKEIIKADKKTIRFETGAYNFGERISQILAVIVSPIVKLYNLITKKINESLHRRSIKKQLIRELNESKKREQAEADIKNSEDTSSDASDITEENITSEEDFIDEFDITKDEENDEIIDELVNEEIEDESVDPEN